jgi:predicted RecB family nuclease
MTDSQKHAVGAVFPDTEGVPAGFQFSQSNLQDFSDCRRRFQLRYLQRFTWPAIQSEPALENEMLIERGNSFHRLAHQTLIGLPVERLEESIQDDILQAWWKNFREFANQAGLKEAVGIYPEMSLSTPFDMYRLTAKYDLIISNDEGQFKIYDWKTSLRQPGRKWLSDRLQTRVYPYLLVKAGEVLNEGKQIEPGKIEMTYWYPTFPDQPIQFPYSAAQFDRDHKSIADMIEEIARLTPNQFQLTSQTQRCAYCVYRSLCERGEQAGRLGESLESLSGGVGESFDAGDEAEIRIDFEQIAEIEL